MISQITIISGSAGPFFATFSLNDSFLGADDRTRLLFLMSQRDVAMATDFVEKWQTPFICRSGISKQNEISLP